MKPKILIDSISLMSSLTGIGRYTYEIAKRIELKEDFESNYFYGYYSKKLLHLSDGKEVKSLKSLIVKNSFIKKIVRTILLNLSKLSLNKYDL